VKNMSHRPAASLTDMREASSGGIGAPFACSNGLTEDQIVFGCANGGGGAAGQPNGFASSTGAMATHERGVGAAAIGLQGASEAGWGDAIKSDNSAAVVPGEHGVCHAVQRHWSRRSTLLTIHRKAASRLIGHFVVARSHFPDMIFKRAFLHAVLALLTALF